MGSTLKLTPEHHRSIAERLHAAIKAGKGIDPPSESIDYGFEDAYRIRRLLVDLQIADGGRPCGHKIGFTSEAMQKMYGMTGPDFGILLDTMFVPAGDGVRGNGEEGEGGKERLGAHTHTHLGHLVPRVDHLLHQTLNF
jgi:hypothetical protein